MKQHEIDFLQKEFETSWQQIRGFDTRRGVFFNFFNFTFVAVLSFSSTMWIKGQEQSMFSTVSLSLIYLMLLFVSYTIIKVLESERKANVRYRKKINLIREMFLSESEDEKIKDYLTRSDIGIKIDSGTRNEIDSVGGTLKNIYRLIHAEQVVLVILFVGVWFNFLIIPI
jgi:hypothetical protein